MSRVAADIVKEKIIRLSRAKREVVLGLATGNSSTEVPISYGQKYADNGGTLIYVLDKIAGRGLLEQKGALKTKKIELEELT